MKIILCFSFLACARTVGPDLENTCEHAGLNNCTFEQYIIMLNQYRLIRHLQSAVISAIKSYRSRTEHTEHVYRESSRIDHDAVRTGRFGSYQSISIHPITSAFAGFATSALYLANRISTPSEIGYHGFMYIGYHGFMYKDVGAMGNHTDRIGKLLETFEVLVMYQVKDTSLYMQLSDKNQISAEHLNENNKDSGVYVIQRVYASDNKLDNIVQIGRNATSWIQVVGNTTTLTTEATPFKTIKTGDDVIFEYYDTRMCYDKKGHTIDMISTKIASQNERLQCVFIEIPV